MSKFLNLVSKLEGQKRSTKRTTKRSTENVQLFTTVYNGLTREERNQLEKYYNDIEKSERGTERIQILILEDGLTREQKNRLQEYYKNKGVKLSIGKQLKVIRVYDQGYILPYECRVNDEEKAVILFASVYNNGHFKIKQSAACSETRFNELMEKDTDAIQNTAVKAFPTLYRVP